MNEIFLDTETTGLSFKEGHKIVEIACIETKDLVATGKVFHKFINPKEAFPKKHLKCMVFHMIFLVTKILSIKLLMNLFNLLKEKK